MTNNDHLNNITGETDTPEISAVKMILTRIDEDLEDDLYEENRVNRMRRQGVKFAKKKTEYDLEQLCLF